MIFQCQSTGWFMVLWSECNKGAMCHTVCCVHGWKQSALRFQSSQHRPHSPPIIIQSWHSWLGDDISYPLSLFSCHVTPHLTLWSDFRFDLQRALEELVQNHPLRSLICSHGCMRGDLGSGSSTLLWINLLTHCLCMRVVSVLFYFFGEIVVI